METLTEQPDPKIGMLLQGRYRIIRMLGQGGMGAVYEAKHELIGRKLAIKCLHRQFLTSPEVLERFQREAQAATAVGNEHIIDVTDMGQFDDGSPFIVMEFLEGKELASLIDQPECLPISRAAHIIIQVCDALSAAHAKGIVHRDLKPENIFLVPHKRDPDFVKVLDFGISKMKESAEHVGRLTQTGMALGTPYFMAPEQAQGRRDVDNRADIYALGVILYRALTGRYPFEADTYPMLMVKIMTESPVPPSRLRNDITPGLEQLVLRAMAKDREQRFRSVEELSNALQACAAAAGDSSAATASSAAQAYAPMAASGNPQMTTPLAWSEAAEARATTVRTGKTPLLVTGGAVGLLALGGIALLALNMNRGASKRPPNIIGRRIAPAVAPTPPAALAPAPQPAQQEIPRVAATGMVEAPKPTEVRVQITALPQGARIFIGEVEFPNPMDAWRPRSLDPIRIRVEKPSYRSVEQLAIFDQERKLSFELEKGKGVKQLAAMTAGQPTAAPAPAASAAVAAPPSPPPSAAPVAAVEKPPAEPRKPAEPAPPAPPPKPDGIYRGPSGSLHKEF